jgi:hypothetical protein
VPAEELARDSEDAVAFLSLHFRSAARVLAYVHPEWSGHVVEVRAARNTQT